MTNREDVAGNGGVGEGGRGEGKDSSRGRSTMTPVSFTEPGGIKNSQSTDDGGDSQQGREDMASDCATGEGGEARGRKWWEEKEHDKANN
jgi:hypothetical protein